MKLTQQPTKAHNGNSSFFKVLLLSTMLSLASCFGGTGSATLNGINSIENKIKKGIPNPLGDDKHSGFNRADGIDRPSFVKTDSSKTSQQK